MLYCSAQNFNQYYAHVKIRPWPILLNFLPIMLLSDAHYAHNYIQVYSNRTVTAINNILISEYTLIEQSDVYDHMYANNNGGRSIRVLARCCKLPILLKITLA